MVVPRVVLGTVSDIKIFREEKPDIGPTELGLGDKAYYGDADVEPPWKKPKGGQLTAEQLAENIVHSYALLCSLFNRCMQLVTCNGRALYLAV